MILLSGALAKVTSKDAIKPDAVQREVYKVDTNVLLISF